MRIIAGRWRGRTIRAPKDDRVRPTGDRAREAWMAIVHPALPGARVLDLFSGSGALGLEALSRGATFCDFVEIAPSSLRAIAENAEVLGALSQLQIHRADAFRFVEALASDAYDVAFADPPYHQALATRLANQWLVEPFARILGIEHDISEVLPAGGETRKYGSTGVTIYRREA
jgi:16S rRNA (guanine966-N2)-methyltransferase